MMRRKSLFGLALTSVILLTAAGGGKWIEIDDFKDSERSGLDTRGFHGGNALGTRNLRRLVKSLPSPVHGYRRR